MPNCIEVTDLRAPELAVYASLTNAQLRSRLEPQAGIFIAESAKVIRLALDAGCEPVSFLMERRHVAGQAAPLLARCPGVPVYTGEREVLASLTGYALTRGVLCAMRRPAPARWQDVCQNARRIAVLENIVDASNVGAIFCSAAALGVDAVLTTPSCCDPLVRRAVRVSMGCVFLVPWAQIGQTHADWPHPGLDELRAAGFRTAALALGEGCVPVDDARLACEEKLALILGTEGDGLCDGTIAACDWRVRIPMRRGVDSLNVAAAAAVAFWQLRARA